jgi:chemosensory pili system protein ChpA (sensor histidine kinase/response regulator)
MISSRSGAKHRQYANELGANGFIGKPWEANQLSNDIKSCLAIREKEVTA